MQMCDLVPFSRAACCGLIHHERRSPVVVAELLFIRHSDKRSWIRDHNTEIPLSAPRSPRAHHLFRPGSVSFLSAPGVTFFLGKTSPFSGSWTSRWERLSVFSRNPGWPDRHFSYFPPSWRSNRPYIHIFMERCVVCIDTYLHVGFLELRDHAQQEHTSFASRVLPPLLCA